MPCVYSESYPLRYSCIRCGEFFLPGWDINEDRVGQRGLIVSKQGRNNFLCRSEDSCLPEISPNNF